MKFFITSPFPVTGREQQRAKNKAPSEEPYCQAVRIAGLFFWQMLLVVDYMVDDSTDDKNKTADCVEILVEKVAHRDYEHSENQKHCTQNYKGDAVIIFNVVAHKS